MATVHEVSKYHSDCGSMPWPALNADGMDPAEVAYDSDFEEISPAALLKIPMI